MNNNVEVDAKLVIDLFADLTSRQQKQVYKNALRKAANILNRETKKLLKVVIGGTINHRNRWNNKTLGSGIKTKVFKDGKEAKVHLMGDFRLKFFEKGTKVRKTKGGANRGSMNAIYYFKKAKRIKESEIFSNLDNLITQSIKRIANKHK